MYKNNGLVRVDGEEIPKGLIGVGRRLRGIGWRHFLIPAGWWSGGKAENGTGLGKGTGGV